ncbi:MAG: hypothetical protein HN457_09530 [Opitutales bacterium]|jgi:periplasmic protein TonB|nr:hypothetical protein [Opitutales bacterium]MBT5168137.1 hypothetical protein [Opitutales bacterium]MBT5814686.1 hypothetical protein [Opitutales bacterium]MBT6378804.1 hypothetical protein [Opitutales bacterium]MBT6767509.1 hypothetical protein [Opitutales bacterium]
MMAHSLETRLSKSTNSVGVAFFAIIGTGILFSAMSLSRLGSVEPPADISVAKIDVFLPPPPPPPPPEVVTKAVTSQVPIQVEVSLDPKPTELTVKPVEVSMDTSVQVSDRIEVNLTEFDRPRIEVNLENIVYDKTEVDEIPARSHSPMPNLPSQLRKKVGDSRVIVQVLIDQKGKPLHVWVLNSPVKEATPYIIKDLMRWRFRPGKKDGQKVRTKVRFVLVFQKSKDSSPFSL